VYDLDRLRLSAEAFRSTTSGSARVLYATMANPRPEILAITRQCDLGAFVNSLSHLAAALQAGVPPTEIMFAGSGHDRSTLEHVAGAGVGYCADSPGQLERYLACSPTGQIGVRVNLGSLLDLAASEDPAPRLGLTLPEVQECLTRHPEVSMLHVYVGTNLTESSRHVHALEHLLSLAGRFAQVTDIDLGGGFSTPPADRAVPPQLEEVLTAWRAATGRHGRALRLTVEPGRSLVRYAGRLFVTVTDVKHRGDQQYAIVDTSATWYPRMVVHGAQDHEVSLASRATGDGDRLETRICGSSTFSRDVLAQAMLPLLEVGDVLELAAAGAYCEAMHMDFLGLPRPGFFAEESGRLRALGS
jgi:diaminopimelate decarboxylase